MSKKYVSLHYLEGKCRSAQSSINIMLQSGDGSDSLNPETCKKMSYDLADNFLAILNEIGFFEDERATNEFISRVRDMS